MKLILQSIKSMIRGIDNRIDKILDKMPTKLSELENDLMAQPDYEQNDDTKPDYIKNRPFYENIQEVIIIDEEEFTFDEYGHYYLTKIIDRIIEIGETFIIIFDNIEYSGIAYERNSDETTCAEFITKNGDYILITDTTGIFCSNLENTTHTIKIAVLESVAAKRIDAKFLPEGMEYNGKDLKLTKTTNEEPISLVDHEERITTHEKRYMENQFGLKDDVTGIDYVVKMHDGNLVYYKKCTGIRFASLPTNLSVIEGGLLDTTGMVIMGTCQDGSERKITDYKLTPVTSNPAEITYEELGEVYTLSVDVNIISIEEALIDFTYTINDDGTYTLTGWNGTLNGETSTRLVIPNSNKIIL